MTSCTYASGAVVTFDTALALPLPDEPVWNFTVTSSGQECLRYRDTSEGFTLTVNGQTFIESASGLEVAVSCPDKTTFASSNALDLLTCPSEGGLFSGLPGKAWSETPSDKPTSVSFSLIGAANGSTNVFWCRTP
jgi:hypothetical protein